eukprot:2693390-Amphidinium_carterae.2
MPTGTKSKRSKQHKRPLARRSKLDGLLRASELTNLLVQDVQVSLGMSSAVSAQHQSWSATWSH